MWELWKHIVSLKTGVPPRYYNRFEFLNRMPKYKSTQKSHEKNLLTPKKILFVIAFFLIVIGLAGLISSSSKNSMPVVPKTENLISNLNFPTSATSSSTIYNVLASSTAKLEQYITPTPTPQTFFRHSKWFFSFEVPEGGTAVETDPNNVVLVANSAGGALVEIPGKLQIEIAVVKLEGLSLFQYYNNRLATIFDEKILKTQPSSESATLKGGYEVLLQDKINTARKTIYFLPLRGNTIFEIEVVYLGGRYKSQEKNVEKILQSLKPY